MSIKYVTIGTIVVVLLGFIFLRANKEPSESELLDETQNEGQLISQDTTNWPTFVGTSNTAHTFEISYPSEYTIDRDALKPFGKPDDAFYVTSPDARCIALSGMHLFEAASYKVPQTWGTPKMVTESMTLGEVDYVLTTIQKEDGSDMIINAKAVDAELTPYEHRFFVDNYDKVAGVYHELDPECVSTFKNMLASYKRLD